MTFFIFTRRLKNRQGIQGALTLNQRINVYRKLFIESVKLRCLSKTRGKKTLFLDSNYSGHIVYHRKIFLFILLILLIYRFSSPVVVNDHVHSKLGYY
jgi:hypothetical protein